MGALDDSKKFRCADLTNVWNRLEKSEVLGLLRQRDEGLPRLTREFGGCFELTQVRSSNIASAGRSQAAKWNTFGRRPCCFNANATFEIERAEPLNDAGSLAPHARIVKSEATEQCRCAARHMDRVKLFATTEIGQSVRVDPISLDARGRQSRSPSVTNHDLAKSCFERVPNPAGHRPRLADDPDPAAKVPENTLHSRRVARDDDALRDVTRAIPHGNDDCVDVNVKAYVPHRPMVGGTLSIVNGLV